MVFGYDKELNAHFKSAASLKYAPWHMTSYTMESHYTETRLTSSDS